VNLPFFIARRYLISKKSHNIINIISAISLVGVLIGSMALIVVLSVFNGLESMVVKNFNAINPDFLITAKIGKVFEEDSLQIQKIKTIDGVSSVARVVDDVTLLTYEEKQYIAHLKGVDDNFGKTNHFDTLIIDGRFALHSGEINYVILGAGVATHLGLKLSSMKAIKAYYPNRLAKNLSDPLTAFNTEMLLPVGVFSAQTESDLTYAIVPLRYMQALTQYDNQLTSIEVYTKPNAKPKQIQTQLARLLGDKFEIKSRYQQEELMYKVMKMENLVVFIILSFILFLATFNIVGTISMLIIEKKKDVEILKNMGADKSLIENIFIAEGVLINLFGGGLGLIIGALICILQQQFGFITMGQDNARYAVNSYPVDMQLVDFLMVFGIITIFGFLSTWIPVKRIIKASFANK
jgi:ABC-type lipoprotein release transport system permease subunit